MILKIALFVGLAIAGTATHVRQATLPSGEARLLAVVAAARERIEFHVGKVEVFVIDPTIDEATAAVLTRELRAIPSKQVPRTATYDLPAGYFLLKSIRFHDDSATVTGTMGPIPAPRDGLVLLACGTTLLIDVTKTPAGWVGKVSSLIVC